MIVKILLLVGLYQLLRATGKPIYCSGIYAGFILFFGLMIGNPFIAVLLATAIAFALSTAYFYLLHMFSESGFYWPILIVGLLIGLV